MLVISAVCIYSAPTFAIELKTKIAETFFANLTSTLCYGVIQITPVDITAKIGDKLGEWPGPPTAVKEAANWFEFRNAGFLQLLFGAVLFNLRQTIKRGKKGSIISILAHDVISE